MTPQIRPTPVADRRPTVIAYAAAIAVGAAVWIGIMLADEVRYAWSSRTYFVVGLPAMMVAAGVLAWLMPERTWSWGWAMVFPQALLAFSMARKFTLWPIALAQFALVASICGIAALAAARISIHKRRRR